MTATRYAALDIGSNSIHLLVCEASATGWKEVYRKALITRLGEELPRSGSIGKRPLERSLAAVRLLTEKADELDAHLAAAATEATRQASDGADVAKALSEAAKTPVAVISGIEEARLTYLGARASGKVSPQERVTIADIGGGSTELASGTDEHPDFTSTIPIGSGSITETYLSDPPSAEECQKARAYAKEIFKAATPSIPKFHQPPKTLLTGGTAATLALFAGGASTLDSLVLERVRTVCLSTPAATLGKRFSVETERARVTSGGLEIAAAFFEYLGVTRMEYVAEGVRLGLIVSTFGDGVLE